jgi:hypothetical protein
LEDGRIALCGIDCAEDFFGEEVSQRFAQTLQNQINQQSKRKVLAMTVNGAAEALSSLNFDWIEVENSYFAAVSGINNWVDREVLERDLSEGTLLLKRTKKRSVQVTTRDSRQITRNEVFEEVTARIKGASCLLLDGRPLGRAKGGLASLAAKAQNPELIKGNAVDELLKKRRAVIELIKEGIEFSRSAHNFFQEQNLAYFQTWYRRCYSGDYPEINLTSDRKLVISHPVSRGLPTVTMLPKELPDPQLLLGLLTSREKT